MNKETKQEYYSNGKLQWELNYENAKPHGLSRGWDENGFAIT